MSPQLCDLLHAQQCDDDGAMASWNPSGIAPLTSIRMRQPPGTLENAREDGRALTRTTDKFDEARPSIFEHLDGASLEPASPFNYGQPRDSSSRFRIDLSRSTT